MNSALPAEMPAALLFENYGGLGGGWLTLLLVDVGVFITEIILLSELATFPVVVALFAILASMSSAYSLT